MSRIKILLVDDHTLVREGFFQMLSLEETLEVCGQAGNFNEAYNLTQNLNPDIILMDIRLSGINGIEATRIIKEKFPKIKIIMLSMYDEDEYVFEAIKAGASGYVLKNISREELIQSIKKVYCGESVIQPVLSEKAQEEFFKKKKIQKLKEISSREIEILKLVAYEKANKEIASFLYISEKTVKAHLRKIFRKLNVADRAQAVAYAVRKGWVE